MSRSELGARDREARRLAQSEYERPLAIEAGAGTGKTAVLIARIVAWSCGPGWERAAPRTPRGGASRADGRERGTAAAGPDDTAARVLERVVAITFTEAAASELAERTAAALGRLAGGGVPEGVEETALPPPLLRVARARALLAASDRLTACTIHAYCRRLLAAFPLEAGLHPGLEIDADGSLRAPVIREVIEARLRDAYTDESDPGLLELARAGVGPRELEDALGALFDAGVPVDALSEDPLAPPRLEAWRRDGLDRAAGLRAAAAQLASVGALRTAAARRALDDTEECLRAAPGSVAELAAAAERLDALWSGPPGNALRDWSHGRWSRGEAGALGASAGPAADAAARLRGWLREAVALRPRALDTARRALEPLHRAADSELRARGIQTYDGLLRDTLALLRAQGPVLRRVRAGIDQLLVDEFQDTDATQCEIVRRIALEAGDDARPGLFVVGDPKQSIYGWRRADLHAYESFLGALEAAGGARGTLFVNFRSVPPILSEVERCVAPVMRARAGAQPRFEPLVACDALAGRPGTIEHWVAWTRADDGSADTHPGFAAASELEAQAVAADLERVHAGGVGWSRIALLFRARTDLEPYLTALRAAGIPYLIEGDRSYYRRREIIEAAALVRAVVDPNDHVSLLGWLRAASGGLPDAALLPLWRRGFPELVSGLDSPDAPGLARLASALREVAGELPDDVPGIERIRGWETSVLDALETLAALRRSFERDAPDVFVERLRELTLFEAAQAAHYLGPYRVANLERFLRHLVEDLCGSEGDLHSLLRALRRRIAQAEDEEEARPHAALDAAVQVRTIHQAKGLDFDHVYLLQTHKRSARNADGPVSCGVTDGRWEYRLFRASSPGFGRLAERRDEVAQAEQVRALYVALTRARARLVIGGLRPAAPGPVDPDRASSHAELLGAREGPALGALWDELASAGRSHAETAGARWVFPALAPQGADGDGLAATALELADPARIAADAASLAARHRSATEHAARPYTAAASAGDDERMDLRELPEHVQARIAAARDVAAAAGTAVHRALERFDLEADPARELERRLGELPRLLEGSADRAEALARARESLERFAGGPLLPRLRALAPAIAARELPFAGPPGTSARAPVGAVLGVIDLLYRDPETGEWVVADYKTDHVSGEAELRARASAYASQGAAYVEAVRSALELPEPPRFELWFVHAGRIVA